MFTRMFLMAASAAVCSTSVFAGSGLPTSACPTIGNLKSALLSAINTAGGQLGIGLNMWATIVAPDGHVCNVVYSSTDAIQGQWLASRVISAQKAFTAVSLSLGTTSNSTSNGALPTGKLALSTGNLYSAVQPGGSLFGLQESNPVFAPGAYGDTIATGGGGMSAANFRPGSEGGVATYAGPISTATYGTTSDPMIGQVIGGINVFGGGLALYTKGGVKVGAVGVSGDTSCTDHLIAWNLRYNLGLDHLGGISGPASLFAGDTMHPDNIIFDVVNGVSPSGFGQPTCGFGATNASATTIAKALHPVSP
jgi:uncharacterized protein GlcG (DUF336 family)